MDLAAEAEQRRAQIRKHKLDCRRNESSEEPCASRSVYRQGHNQKPIGAENWPTTGTALYGPAGESWHLKSHHRGSMSIRQYSTEMVSRKIQEIQHSTLRIAAFGINRFTETEKYQLFMQAPSGDVRMCGARRSGLSPFCPSGTVRVSGLNRLDVFAHAKEVTMTKSAMIGRRRRVAVPNVLISNPRGRLCWWGLGDGSWFRQYVLTKTLNTRSTSTWVCQSSIDHDPC